MQLSQHVAWSFWYGFQNGFHAWTCKQLLTLRTPVGLSTWARCVVRFRCFRFSSSQAFRQTAEPIARGGCASLGWGSAGNMGWGQAVGDGSKLSRTPKSRLGRLIKQECKNQRVPSSRVCLRQVRAVFIGCGACCCSHVFGGLWARVCICLAAIKSGSGADPVAYVRPQGALTY